MVSHTTNHMKKSKTDKIENAILKMLHSSDISIYLLIKRRRLFGRNFSKSDQIEIIAPVPQAVESENVTKVSGEVGNQFPGPAVKMDLERKKSVRKRFKDRDKEGE
jgi:hypothetical protein